MNEILNYIIIALMLSVIPMAIIGIYYIIKMFREKNNKDENKAKITWWNLAIALYSTLYAGFIMELLIIFSFALRDLSSISYQLFYYIIGLLIASAPVLTNPRVDKKNKKVFRRIVLVIVVIEYALFLLIFGECLFRSY